VRAISAGKLAALVSDVDLAEFGEAALARNLEDLDWLEKVARAHHQVIAAAARLAPVLPLRLATVYRGDAAATAMLAERGEELAAELDRVGGRLEWGVKAYPAPAGTAGQGAAGASTVGRAREARSAASGDGAGLAYLRRRRTQLTAARESAQTAAVGARAVHTELASQSNAARLHAAQAPSLSGSGLPMLLNAAYLLDAGSETGSRFAAVVAAMASAHPELRIELTGPWPPYSFTGENSLDDDGSRPLPGGDAGPQAAENG
jgi:hypothetical protein